MIRRSKDAAPAAAIILALLSIPVREGRAADFYAGKTMTFVVSSDAGGGYDAYTRVLARHIAKYIPGSPTVVVLNEPGAGGLRAAQDLYSLAEKDGTRIGNLRSSNMLDSILGIRGTEIDPNKYEWIGAMTSDTDLCSFWYTAGVHSFEDLKRKEVIVGASGKGAQNYSFPSAINDILHTKMKIVVGYEGIGDRILAVQRGELQGNCGMNTSDIISRYAQLFSSGKLIPIVQSGLHPYAKLPNVPLTQSFASTDQQRRVLESIFGQMDIVNVFTAPPGTPKERVEILRKAFTEVMRDPDLIADAEKEGIDLDPKSGEGVAKVVADMTNIPANLKAEARAAIGE